jgi:hypothetical protein
MVPPSQFHNKVLDVVGATPPPAPGISINCSLNQTLIFFRSKSNTSILNPPLPGKRASSCVNYWSSRFDGSSRSNNNNNSNRRRSGGGGGRVLMASSPHKNLKTSNHLRHLDSMKTLPSGAGKISHLNAVVLGESLASEENDLVFPSEEFSRQAHVPSPEKVAALSLAPLLFFFFFFFFFFFNLNLCFKLTFILRAVSFAF